MKYKAACLVPLYESPEPLYRLPQEGPVTIGRRSNSTIILKDAAVSGTHCVLTCIEPDTYIFEVEDRSTNGTFVNDMRISKGQRERLCEGDVLSLGKAGVTEEQAALGMVAPPRIQFRLEVQLQERSVELLGQPSAVSNNQLSSIGADAAGAVTQPASLALPASVPTPPPVPTPAPLHVVSAGTHSAEGFAQDLLVQEQRSKAKITGELLLIRRRLDEERSRNEALERDLRKARATLEDERSRSATVSEARRRLQVELEQLKHDHENFQELRQRHVDLQNRHETVEADLGAQLQRATSLEAAQETLREDLERTRADTARAEALLTEARTRLQQAQERAEGLQERQRERRSHAEAAREATEKLKRQLCSERGAWEPLHDQVTLLRADAERAEQGQRDASEALALATSEQANLEAQVSKSRADIIEARKSAEEARQRLRTAAEQAEQLRTAAGRFAEGTRSHVDHWMRGVVDCSDLAGSDASRYIPPFAANGIATGTAVPSRTAAVEPEPRAVVEETFAAEQRVPKSMLTLRQKWEDCPSNLPGSDAMTKLPANTGVTFVSSSEAISVSATKEGAPIKECLAAPSRRSPKAEKSSAEHTNGSEGSASTGANDAVKRTASTSILTAPGIQLGLKRFRPGKAR